MSRSSLAHRQDQDRHGRAAAHLGGRARGRPCAASRGRVTTRSNSPPRRRSVRAPPVRRCRHDLVSLALERVADDLADRRLVVGDENRLTRAALGRAISKSVPPPPDASARRSAPPFSSTRLRAIESPRPRAGNGAGFRQAHEAVEARAPAPLPARPTLVGDAEEDRPVFGSSTETRIVDRRANSARRSRGRARAPRSAGSDRPPRAAPARAASRKSACAGERLAEPRDGRLHDLGAGDASRGAGRATPESRRTTSMSSPIRRSSASICPTASRAASGAPASASQFSMAAARRGDRRLQVVGELREQRRLHLFARARLLGRAGEPQEPLALDGEAEQHGAGLPPCARSNEGRARRARPRAGARRGSAGRCRCRRDREGNAAELPWR